MNTEELTRLFQAERAVRPPPQALDRGLARFLTELGQHAGPLSVVGGVSKLGWSMASKWIAVGFAAGLAGAGAAAQAFGPEPTAAPTAPPWTSSPAIASAAPVSDVDVAQAETEMVTEQPVRSEGRGASPVTSAATFDAELQLIVAAKRELDRGQPRLASAWLDDHAQRFPSGVFAMDREALRVLVDCGSRPNPTLAREFAARHPGSAMLERLLRACGPSDAAKRSPSRSAVDFPK